MGRLGFYFDNSVCTGCRTCQVACKDKNRLEVGTIFRNVRSYESGSYPDAKIYHYSASCNHCEKPACVTACPSGAMYQAEDGTVICDTELCDGCQACVAICPYEVPQYIEETGKVGKCDACAGLRAKGENPACVDACLMRCLDFGDLDELAKKYGGDLVNELPILPDPSMTNPSVLINPKECALEEDYREVTI
ncbi:MAG: 4Fe-4S dicluster domain-containing protein [Lachnospiraceae bacterium]|nr:4Fe-4S dicluster domain-containing protein [Lachnospiraceae bacterium]